MSSIEDDLDEDELVDTLAVRRSGPHSVRYEDYGPERWPIAPVDEWVEIRNPRPAHQPVRIEIAIGPDPRIGVALERLRPAEQQLPPKRMQQLLEKFLPIRAEYLRVILTIGSGESVKIPRCWLNAIRKVRAGMVVAGLCPDIEVVGGPNYPLADALLGDRRPPAPVGRRRRTETP